MQNGMYRPSQLFFKIPHETLKFQEKFKRNAFSCDLQALISKLFPSVPTMGPPHRATELSKQ